MFADSIDYPVSLKQDNSGYENSPHKLYDDQFNAIEPSTRQPPHTTAQRKRNRDAYTPIHSSIDVVEQAWEQAQSAYNEAQKYWLKVEHIVAKIQGHTYLIEEMKAKWYTFRIESREYDRINERSVLNVINCWEQVKEAIKEERVQIKKYQEKYPRKFAAALGKLYTDAEYHNRLAMELDYCEDQDFEEQHPRKVRR